MTEITLLFTVELSTKSDNFKQTDKSITLEVFFPGQSSPLGHGLYRGLSNLFKFPEQRQSLFGICRYTHMCFVKYHFNMYRS